MEGRGGRPSGERFRLVGGEAWGSELREVCESSLSEYETRCMMAEVYGLVSQGLLLTLSDVQHAKHTRL